MWSRESADRVQCCWIGLPKIFFYRISRSFRTRDYSDPDFPDFPGFSELPDWFLSGFFRIVSGFSGFFRIFQIFSDFPGFSGFFRIFGPPGALEPPKSPKSPEGNLSIDMVVTQGNRAKAAKQNPKGRFFGDIFTPARISAAP